MLKAMAEAEPKAFKTEDDIRQATLLTCHESRISVTKCDKNDIFLIVYVFSSLKYTIFFLRETGMV